MTFLRCLYALLVLHLRNEPHGIGIAVHGSSPLFARSENYRFTREKFGTKVVEILAKAGFAP
jgi:hypothetical protein